MSLYRNRYRVESARLSGRDYAAPGWYFVTICTNDRRHWFGEIRAGAMDLTPPGRIAHRSLAAIPDHSNRAVLDAIVVMPNHVHALIGLRAGPNNSRDHGADETHRPNGGDCDDGSRRPNGGDCGDVSHRPNDGGRDVACNVSTPSFESNPGAPHDAPSFGSNPGSPIVPNRAMSQMSPTAGSLSAIVRSYKSAVTREIRRAGDVGFAWQTRFHDRIVRDRRAFLAIRNYILQNPSRWEADGFGPNP